jgi:hypothetical protein
MALVGHEPLLWGVTRFEDLTNVHVLGNDFRVPEFRESNQLPCMSSLIFIRWVACQVLGGGVVGHFNWSITKKNFYVRTWSASLLAHLYSWDGEDFEQRIWDIVRCYCEHHWEHMGTWILKIHPHTPTLLCPVPPATNGKRWTLLGACSVVPLVACTCIFCS